MVWARSTIGTIASYLRRFPSVSDLGLWPCGIKWTACDYWMVRYKAVHGVRWRDGAGKKSKSNSSLSASRSSHPPLQHKSRLRILPPPPSRGLGWIESRGASLLTPLPLPKKTWVWERPRPGWPPKGVISKEEDRQAREPSCRPTGSAPRLRVMRHPLEIRRSWFVRVVVQHGTMYDRCNELDVGKQIGWENPPEVPFATTLW